MGCDIHTVVQKKYGDAWLNLTEQPYFPRNYTVFTILADVRRRDDALPIIAEPRGLPSDFDDVEDIANDPDWHTHSWLLLSEILDYDWRQTLHVSGWVDVANFSLWDAGKLPHDWCQGVFGGGVVHCSHVEMRQHLLRPSPSPHAFTQVQWTVPVGDYCQSFLDVIKGLENTGNPQRIRLVFWFDN